MVKTADHVHHEEHSLRVHVLEDVKGHKRAVIGLLGEHQDEDLAEVWQREMDAQPFVLILVKKRCTYKLTITRPPCAFKRIF